MARRKLLRSGKRGGGRTAYRKANRSKQTEKVSDSTLMIMMLLVLVVSVLSVTMYMYAFYGVSPIAQKSSETRSVPADQQAVSGVATMQIIQPPEGSK